jgi:hypothetical protein
MVKPLNQTTMRSPRDGVPGLLPSLLEPRPSLEGGLLPDDGRDRGRGGVPHRSGTSWRRHKLFSHMSRANTPVGRAMQDEKTRLVALLLGWYRVLLGRPTPQQGFEPLVLTANSKSHQSLMSCEAFLAWFDSRLHRGCSLERGHGTVRLLEHPQRLPPAHDYHNQL